MKRLFLALAFLAFMSSARAQESTSPAETALQIDGVINSWAQTITQQLKTIKALETKNAELQKQLDDLKPKKDEEPK